MLSESRWQWLVAAAANLYLFFLCSARWNAGTSISAGLLGVLIVLFYVVQKRKVQWTSSYYLLCYGIFMGSVLLASWLTGDKASIQLSHKFVSYSLPLWLFYLVLQQSQSILRSTFWGTVTGSWVLLALTVRDLLHPLKDGRVHASFASANNFAMCLEAILPLLWLGTWELWEQAKQNSTSKKYFYVGALTSLLLTGALFLSRSRGGIAGFVLGAVAVLLFSRLYTMRVWNIRKRISMLIFLFGVMAAVLFGGTMTFQHRSYDSERLLLLQSAYRMWEDHQLYGVGFQKWNQIYRQKYILPGAREPDLSLAHNNVANFFSGTGTLGGVGYLLFTFGSFYVLLKKLVEQPESPYGKLLLWVWLAIFIHGMVDNSLYAKFNTRLYFAMWGIGLAAMAHTEKEKLGKK